MTQTLCQAPIAAWDALVQLTIDREAAFLLLAGDICNGAERAVTAQLRFLGGLQRLSARGIRTFMVRGADDPQGPWAAIHQWPDGVFCFGPDRVESVGVTREGERLATVHGISHSSKHHDESRGARFSRSSEPGLHVGLLHASVDQINDDAPCSPHSLDELAAANLDYWALGHDHRHRVLSQGRPWIVYPGTPQGRGFTSQETGPKGAVVVDVHDERVTNIAFHALDAARLVLVESDVSQASGLADLTRMLRERGAVLLEEAAARSLVARAVLHGSWGVWTRDPDAGSLQEQVLEALRAEEPGALSWDSVLDLTELPAGDAANQTDAVARVRAAVAALRQEPARLERFLADEVESLGVLPPGGRLEPGDVDTLLMRAERLAIDYLERERS